MTELDRDSSLLIRYARTQVHLLTQARTLMHAYTHAHMHSHIHANSLTQANVRACAGMHARARARAHTHTQTHTHRVVGLNKEKAPESRTDKLTTMLGDRPVHVVLPPQHWLRIYINISVDFFFFFSNI